MTETSAAATFTCSKCGVPHQWDAHIVGKMARCACGHILKVPDSPHWVRPQDVNPLELLRKEAFDAPELADEPAGTQPVVRTAPPPSAARDLHLPVILLAIAVVGILLQALDLSERHGDSMLGHLILAVLESIINASLAAGAILVLSLLMRFRLGKAQAAILRLVAAAVAPWGLGLLVSSILGGGTFAAAAGWMVALCAWWVLVQFFFRREARYTLICVLVIVITRLVTAWLLAAG